MRGSASSPSVTAARAAPFARGRIADFSAISRRPSQVQAPPAVFATQQRAGKPLPQVGVHDRLRRVAGALSGRGPKSGRVVVCTAYPIW